MTEKAKKVTKNVILYVAITGFVGAIVLPLGKMCGEYIKENIIKLPYKTNQLHDRIYSIENELEESKHYQMKRQEEIINIIQNNNNQVIEKFEKMYRRLEKIEKKSDRQHESVIRYLLYNTKKDSLTAKK